MATYSKEKLKATTKGTGNFVRCMDFDVDIGFEWGPTSRPSGRCV